MATFTIDPDDGRNVVGNQRFVGGTYTGPVSYAAGGDPITVDNLGLSDIRNLFVGVAANAALTTFRSLVVNPAQTKILWVVPNTGAEVAAATDLSGFTAFLWASGR